VQQRNVTLFLSVGLLLSLNLKNAAWDACLSYRVKTSLEVKSSQKL